MEKRRISRILQRSASSDFENCSKLSFTAHDKGENLKVFLDFNACDTETSLGFTEEDKELLDSYLYISFLICVKLSLSR